MLGIGDLREAFGVAMLAVQLLVAVPIIVKLVQTRGASGFSLAGEGIWVVMGLAWIGYGVGTHSVILTISGSLAALTSLIIVALIVSNSADQYRQSVVLVTATAGAFLLGFALFGLAGLTLVLAILGVVQFAPQFFRSLRDLRERNIIRGVSVVGVAMRGVYTLAWAVYAAGGSIWPDTTARVDWPLVAWGFAGALTFGLQAFVARRSVRR